MKDITNDQPPPTVGAVRDLQERRTANAALSASEIRYRRLFEAAHDGILILDPVTRKIIDANPFMTQLLGYSHDQLIGMELYEIGFLADTQASREMFQTLKATRQVRYENLPLQTRQGGLRDVEVVANLYDEDSRTVVQCNVRDITERKAAEMALAKNDERQAFLLKLGDIIRGHGDPLEIQSAALRVLGEHLVVNRVFYNEIDEDRDAYVIYRTYANGVAPLTGHFRLSELQWTAKVAGAGQIVMFNDATADPRLSVAERASYAAMDVVAGVGVPLIKDGRWVASLGVHQATPRHWKPEELDLIRETAERTWAAVERARTEAALAASEQRFRTLIEATSAVTWSCAPSGQFVEIQPQWSAFTGQSTSEMLGAGYTTAFHPDDADNATARLADAVARDVPYFNELRIRRHDGEWRWMRVHCVPVHRDGVSVERFGMCIDITEKMRAEEHAQLLLAEVNHRAMNLLSVVQAVAQQTAKSGDPQTFSARLSQRIGSLAANQDLLVKCLWRGVDIRELVTSQLAHFKDSIGTRVHLHGPELTVTAAASQTIGMAVHELATNAAKYGALSSSNGQVHVEWQLSAGPDSQFLMSWRESGGPLVKPPTGKGFGQIVIKRIVETSLDGHVKVDYAEDGFSWQLATAAGNVLVTSRGGIMNLNENAR